MKVHYHSDIDFNPTTNSVVIIDESDEHVFNDPTKFMKFTRRPGCICLTATVAEDYENGIER